MSNCIVMEGLTLYVFLLLILCMALIGLVGLWSAIKSDLKAEKLRERLFEEREKSIYLNRENMRLKLKYGELKVGEKIDV